MVGDFRDDDLRIRRGWFRDEKLIWIVRIAWEVDWRNDRERWDEDVDAGRGDAFRACEWKADGLAVVDRLICRDHGDGDKPFAMTAQIERSFFKGCLLSDWEKALRKGDGIRGINLTMPGHVQSDFQRGPSAQGRFGGLPMVF